MNIDFYPKLPAFGSRPNLFLETQGNRRWPSDRPNAYQYYEASFADSEGTALDVIRNEWLACVGDLNKSLSEPVADTIQINGSAGGSNLSAWVPRLISGVNNKSQFCEVVYVAGTSSGGAPARPEVIVCFSGDPMTPAVIYNAYCLEFAEEVPAIRIQKATNLTAVTTLATVAASPVINGVYRIEAEFDGADVNLRVLEDESEILSAVDAGGYQVGLPAVGVKSLPATRLFRFRNFRCGILAYA